MHGRYGLLLEFAFRLLTSSVEHRVSLSRGVPVVKSMNQWKAFRTSTPEMMLRHVMRCWLPIAVFSVVLSVSAFAQTTVNFDDLAPNPVKDGIGVVPSPYAGLTWQCAGNPSCQLIDGATYVHNPSGYQGAVISRSNVLSTGYGGAQTATAIKIGPAVGRTFALDSAYFTGAWLDGITVSVVGMNGTKTVKSTNFSLGAAGVPSLRTFNWPNLTSVVITPSGGTPHAGYAYTLLILAIDNLTYTPATATPAFSPAGGTYSTPQTVSISDATGGASIYYTTNGSTPTTASIKYTAAIKVSSTETIKAIAVASAHLPSSVASATYSISAEPVVATALYSFSGIPTGDTYPIVGLIQGTDGNFYGTAGGGDYTGGTVFKMTPEGVETVLHSFGGGADGYAPRAPLIQSIDGNFYGTTYHGGSGVTGPYGTIYKISPSGHETVFYDFPHHYIDGTLVDGLVPQAGLVQDSHGNFYGTTLGGTNANGTVFKINPAGLEVWLYTFAGGADGAASGAPLVEGRDGNFYGTTNPTYYSPNSTVFKITPDGVETIIHSFDSATDGKGPIAGLIQADDGNFYGTTENGGTYGAGTVFKITPDGQETVLHSFGNGSDGAYPIASLMQGSDGNLYGTTVYGGAYAPSGTVFKITPEGVETVIYSFAPSGYGYFPIGEQPQSALIQGSDGNLYGTATFGGASGLGTIFKLTGAMPGAAKLNVDRAR